MQLFINTFGTSLRRKGDRFCIRKKGQDGPVEVAAQKVQSIVIATGVHLSSNAIHLATEHNIDIVFLDKSGHPSARVWQTKMGSTAEIRRRQLEASETDEAMRYVKEWTTSKINNQLEFLRELKQRRPGSDDVFASPLNTLQECVQKVASCSGTVDQVRGTLMGLEGAAGRAYFTCLGKLMPAEYRFTGRSRRPAVDPFNAMLNYSYGVLYSRVERALILAGLDPFVGFLHTDNYNKRSLVFDMIEPFRILGERTTVMLFTGRRAKKEYFREVPGGIELSPDGRPVLMESFNVRLDRTVRYPVQSDKAQKKFRKIKQAAVIQHEAHALANSLLGRHDIPKIVETEDLFSGDE
jgi:CRISPR-associated protein Cas1